MSANILDMCISSHRHSNEKQYFERLEQITSIFLSTDVKYTSRTLVCMFVGYIS